MDNSSVFSINGQSFNGVYIVELATSYEILDGKETGRTEGEGWNMIRAPEGTIVNIDKITFGNGISNNPDFTALLNVIAGFGVHDFQTVRFMSPLGIVEQQMYIGGKVAVDLRETYKTVDGEQIILWGTISTKFTAQEAYYTPSNTRGL